MNKVEKTILEVSKELAKKEGRFIPSSKNNVDATVVVCSGSKSVRGRDNMITAPFRFTALNSLTGAMAEVNKYNNKAR